jgi:hypothetical protein
MILSAIFQYKAAKFSTFPTISGLSEETLAPVLKVPSLKPACSEKQVLVSSASKSKKHFDGQENASGSF